MKPVTFSARIGTAQVRGTFVYAGQATGTITTESGTGTAASPGTASPSPQMTASPGMTGPSPDAGAWRPVGDLDWDETTFTVDLTEPVQARPFDNVPLGQYTGEGADQTGNVVDIDPFFDAGRYTCQGDRLTVTPDEDGDLPMVLQRA
jgi:hypothetical protein